MKTCAVIMLMLVLTARLASADAEHRQITYRDLVTESADYAGGKVTYLGVFRDVRYRFTEAMRSAGFTRHTYVWLIIGDMQVPAILERTDDTNPLLGQLRKKQIVRVFGTVETWPESIELPEGLLPFFVRVDKLEPNAVQEDTKDVPQPPMPPPLQ